MLLEKVWLAEIECRLPAQIGKSKAVYGLEEKGLISKVSRSLKGPWTVVITGWELTHAGRFLYCSWADENYED